jgi:uncharacterized damage-inducible protein DinB
MPLEYDDLPRTVDERATLVSFLEWQRATLERKCAGLPPEQLRVRSAPPSTLSLIGLVRHMAEVERSWFRRTAAGEDVATIYSSATDPDGDFNDVGGTSVDDVFATWHTECERAREIVAARDLDDVCKQRSGREVSVRWIVVHMIEEYSRHNGHADLLRQRIDGAVGY